MQSNKKRIRIDYAPLNVAVSIQCTTPLSPALQVFNAALASGQQYEPDREVSPSQFWPEVIANAADGSWLNQYGNMLLTDMHWYIDGVEISEHPDWQGNNSLGDPKYEIDNSSTNYRGSISIKQNISPDKQYSLHFEGVIADMRLGTLIPITTDPVILSTQDVSTDGFSLSIGDDQVIQYNPFKDKLHLYEYQVAHGKVTASSAAETAATDENAYKRTIPITVHQGAEIITTGFTIKLYRVDGASTFTELTPESNKEVLSVSNAAIVLDLRLITKEDFLVVAVLSDSTHPNPQIQFSVNRVYQNYNLEPTNGAGILPSDTQRYDEVMCSSDGNTVEDPESIIQIDWYTDTVDKTHLHHNEGQKTIFTIAKTGIGNTYSDCWMEIQCEGEIKPAMDVAIDESGNTLVDENGDTLIFN